MFTNIKALSSHDLKSICLVRRLKLLDREEIAWVKIEKCLKEKKLQFLIIMPKESKLQIWKRLELEGKSPLLCGYIFLSIFKLIILNIFLRQNYYLKSQNILYYIYIYIYISS